MLKVRDGARMIASSPPSLIGKRRCLHVRYKWPAVYKSVCIPRPVLTLPHSSCWFFSLSVRHASLYSHISNESCHRNSDMQRDGCAHAACCWERMDEMREKVVLPRAVCRGRPSLRLLTPLQHACPIRRCERVWPTSALIASRLVLRAIWLNGRTGIFSVENL